ncbi:MAG: PD-(D/E)XK nuclease family protein [Verrucomicrobiaceae bacterium]|nr:MAG: PD-(D/E)XK nuclease family protein [Verrucomicrobiaceae bacterium]
MSAPSLTFLDQDNSLAHQVAGFLLREMSGRPWDLSGTQVWIPTAGAASRIRFALAGLASGAGTGVLAPRFLQPMAAILPDQAVLATRAEREGAWAGVLREAPLQNVDALFPVPLGTDSRLMEAGGLMCELCDMLGEAAISPLHPDLPRICGEDESRWEQIGSLYRDYLNALRGFGLVDPNEARAAQIRQPVPPPDLRAVVIACIPDLTTAAALYAEALMARGIAVEVLVWKPGPITGGFDKWGRPVPADWAACEIPVTSEHIIKAKDPKNEAAQAVRYLSAATPPGDYALVLADPELAPAFRSEVLRCGGRPFLPGGDDLSATEPAIVALGWIEWRSSGRLRTLRRLLECPQFARWVGAKAKLPISRLLSTCNFLISQALLESFDQASSFLAAYAGDDAERKEKEAKLLSDTKALVEALQHFHGMFPDEVLRQAWKGRSDAASDQVLDLFEQIRESPVFSRWPDGGDLAFSRALNCALTFSSSEPGDVEFMGWLEAPWAEASRLALCGCVEGRLPASVNGHIFLPDSRRGPLGILDNAARRARDSYLLTCLLSIRPTDDIRCSFSKFGADGGPALPSNLLLRCPDAEIPTRILNTFGGSESSTVRPRRENHWLWRLPDDRRKAVEKISPTGFKEYLSCPFRYYFKRVLYLEEFEPQAREMDALRFGSLVHKAIELFSKSTPDEGDRKKIESLVIAHLESEAGMLFGPTPSPAVRVQLEAAKVRLRAFAGVQAGVVAGGWKILEAEWKLDANRADPMKIGPLKFSAQIDRIEEHPDGTIRVIDYKTYAKLKSPEETHFGSAAANAFLEEAKVLVDGKQKCWVDLQLPLYRFIAERRYPGRPIHVAYFILGANPSETSIQEFDLSDELQNSAVRCAEAVAARVACGEFWPPQPHKVSWEDPFESLFLNGAPEKCFDPETIAFLKGRA